MNPRDRAHRGLQPGRQGERDYENQSALLCRGARNPGTGPTLLAEAPEGALQSICRRCAGTNRAGHRRRGLRADLTISRKTMRPPAENPGACEVTPRAITPPRIAQPCARMRWNSGHGNAFLAGKLTASAVSKRRGTGGRVKLRSKYNCNFRSLSRLRRTVRREKGDDRLPSPVDPLPDAGVYLPSASRRC